MTDKFIPFNPETAKNGDTVYYIDNRFLFVGVNPKYRGECFLIQPGGTLILANNSGVTVKAPKKAVWVNLIKYHPGDAMMYAYVYESEKQAKEELKSHMGHCIGTYPLEIDDVA